MSKTYGIIKNRLVQSPVDEMVFLCNQPILIFYELYSDRFEQTGAKWNFAVNKFSLF